MWPFRKKEEIISRVNPGFEEHGERKTPKAGVVLLLLMFVAGLYFGWTALSDIGGIANPPAPLSGCSSRYQDYSSNSYRTGYSSIFGSNRDLHYNYYDYGYDSGDSAKCQFSELEKKYRIPSVLEKRLPLEEKLREAQAKHSLVQTQLFGAQNSRTNLERQYGIGLQERQAGVPRQVYQINPAVQNQITALIAEENRLQNILAEHTAEISTVNADLKRVDAEIKEAYRPVFEEQNKKLRFYELKVFLLQFVFVLPLFILSLFLYTRLLKKNSPYAVIFVPIVGVIGILMLRVILVWFWGLFLARIFEVLLQWFAMFEVVRSVIFYLGMLLSFAIFGGGVYYLQKRIFDPRRVIIRRFRAKQCPHCQTNLDLSLNYCPNCGQKIREACPKCGNPRFMGMPACPSCGDK